MFQNETRCKCSACITIIVMLLKIHSRVALVRYRLAICLQLSSLLSPKGASMSLNLLSAAMIALFSFNALAAVVDCPTTYPNGSILSYADGSMRYPNGNTLRYSDSSIRYPNGNILRYIDGSLRYQNGNNLKYTDSQVRYENGNTARNSDGSMRDINGSNLIAGSININTAFGDENMRVVLKAGSLMIHASVAYGNDGVLLLEINEAGDISCTVEGGSNGLTDFKLSGNNGTAFVNIKPGKNAQAIKNAIQKILDQN